TYEVVGEGTVAEQLEAGRLDFALKGEKLRGAFTLLKMKRREGEWLLFKRTDEFAEAGWELRLRKPENGVETIKGKAKKSKGDGGARPKEGAGHTRKFDTKKAAGKAVAVSGAMRRKALEGDVSVKVGREVVPLTHLERVYWPGEGYTKGDLVRYYHEVSDYILPYLKDRPLIMKRYPSGIEGPYFHQHDVDEAPSFVRTVPLEVEDGGGHEVDYIVGDNLATLLYMANLGAVERHPWHSRVADLEHPDWFVFDLDPGEGVEFTTICDVAVTTRDVLARIGLESYPKTSGSRGIHVYVPVEPVYEYEQIAELAEQLATVVAREQSEVATVERSKRKRGEGMIYVDHMQNARGKSVVAPYSVRPKPGATVSAPLEWKEVERKKIKTADFHIRNMLKRVERKGDLFEPVLKRRQSLEGVFERARELFKEGSKRRRAQRA
ncbi:MAG TPA: non-homologous end-joining DNA ligase, partial [Pyrinomonadaceae bacterium]